mmetsp:Transcript_9522/g.10902  ORF Transcript_9522/g.10902 Transcript_9522/m.10902 type:complete len:553 (+) Transcript_9522:35-1693(+)
MTTEERLKRRTVTRYNNGNNNNNNSNNNTARRSYTSIPTPEPIWRKRRKRKTSSSWTAEICFASLQRIARNFIWLRRLGFLFTLTASFLFFEKQRYNNSTSVKNLRKQASEVYQTTTDMMEFEISFRNLVSSESTVVALPAILHGYAIEMGEYQDNDNLDLDYLDYGDFGLDFERKNFERVGRPRNIFQYDYLSTTEFRDIDSTPQDDDNDAYYALDDDFIRDIQDIPGHVCRRVSEHRRNYQNCNTIFETSYIDNYVFYINEGAYRQVFGLQQEHEDSIVIKEMHSSIEFKTGDFEFVRMDAMVAERLTSSPRIYDIYGYCGTAIMSQYFPHGDYEDVAVPGSGYLLTKEEKTNEQINDLEAHNNITSTNKLKISLQMAEALADLHGDPMGATVHQDIQLSQYLLSSDKQILKLNDFNRAEFMLWNDNKGEYCKYSEGSGNGNWRSPEEYFDNNLDEKVDIFSLGNNIYSILTGLWVFYDEDNDEKIKERVKAGEKAYIDPRYKERSLAEAKLVDIIEQCHQFDPEGRPSIFEVVEFLREAIVETNEMNQL